MGARETPVKVHSILSIALCGALPLVGCGRDDSLPLGLRFDTGVIAPADGGEDPDGAVPTDADVVEVGVPDTGSPDLGVPPVDSGVIDTGPPPFDAGFGDASVPDFGAPVDSGVPDTGPPPFDAGFGDASVPDFGVPPIDSGVPDTGPPPFDGGLPDVPPPIDGGAPDSGLPDANVPDSGVACPGGCAFLDDACNVGVCAPDGFSCVAVPRPAGTTCSDNDPCTSNDTCSAGRCVGGAPVDCSALDGPCTAGICDPTTGGCRAQNVMDGTACTLPNNPCGGGTCSSGQCIPTTPPPVPGDTCATPISVSLQPGTVRRSGDTTCAADDETGTCALAVGGNDVVFSLDPGNVTRRVVATTEPPMSGSGFDTVLHLRRSCTFAQTELACDDDTAGAGFSRAEAILTRRPVFLFVDGTSALESGPFELRLDVDPQDTCSDPSPLEFPQVSQTTFERGNTTGAANTFSASCGAGAGGPDHVWELTVPLQADLRFETTNPGIGQFDTVIHVKSACTAGGANELECDDDSGQGSFSVVEGTFAPGTYYVIVDGFGNAQGEYVLRVTQLEPIEFFPFPSATDARLPTSGVFANVGDFVEGIRDPVNTSMRRLEMDLQVTNNLTCGVATFVVRLNNQDVGAFDVRPGDTSIQQSFGFERVFGSQFNIRYQLQAITANCGSVSFPNTGSTVGLGD